MNSALAIQPHNKSFPSIQVNADKIGQFVVMWSLLTLSIMVVVSSGITICT